MSGGGSRRRAGLSWHSTLSRFFIRSPPGEGAAHSSENKGSEAIDLKSSQKESTTLPALLKACPNEEKNHSTEELSKSEIQEELKKANSLPSLTPAVKTADKDKQPREGFFHFLGSLFNIATKSSLVESKPSTFQDEPNRCEKDLRNAKTLPKDAQPKHPNIEEPVCSTARAKEDSVHKDDAIPNNIGKEVSQDLQGGRKQPADAQKQTRRKPEAPAVTYATYRGSARIRQLLRSQSGTSGKGEESPENGNASTVKENGEIQRTPSLESGRLAEEDGGDEGKDRKDDAVLNPAAVRTGSKRSGRTKHEPAAKATTSSTESCHELDFRRTPALSGAQVKRTCSLESFLSFGSRNGEVPTNSTSQVTHSLRVSSADDLIGRGDGLLGEAGALLQPNENATFNLDKENGCSKAANKDDCLHSQTLNEELQVGKGEFCWNPPTDNPSGRTLGVQMPHFSATTFQQQAGQQTGSANKDSRPRKNDPQSVVGAVEREQNPRNLPATVLLPFNEQIPTSRGMESKGGTCMPTSNLSTSLSSLGRDERGVMGRETHKEPRELGKPVPVLNGHGLIHVESSKDAATQHTGLPSLETEGVETMKVLADVAVENVADVSPCVRGCQGVQTSSNELTAPLSGTSKSSFETGGCCPASLHLSCKFKDKAMGEREVGLKDAGETLSRPDLEYGKSKSFEPVDRSLSKNSVPVHNHDPVPLETVQDIPAESPVLAEDNAAPCPLIATGGHTPASSKPHQIGVTGAPLVTCQCEGCTVELASHVSKSREENVPVSHSASGCEGRPLVNHSAFTWEKDAVGIVSESPPLSEKRCISYSSKEENSNEPRISPTVLDSPSDNQGKVLPSATSSENGQTAPPDGDSFVFPAAEFRRVVLEDGMKEGASLRALCPAGSPQPEMIPLMVGSSADGVNGGGGCVPSPPLGSREVSNLSVPALEMAGIAQGNSNSSRHGASAGAEESFAEQAGSGIVAEAMPPPVCPLKSLGAASEPACSEPVCWNAAGQVIPGGPSVTGGQAAAAPAGSHGLCSQGQREGSGVRGQGTAFQDAAALFKKAEEIVDSVLHLATEEIITKQALGVWQPCGSKDGLVNGDALNYQKAETVQLEGEEIHSAVQSLKGFNESSGGVSSSLTGNEGMDTNNQDEKILPCIPDKTDPDSALALKAKETVEEVINSALQKLASSQWQGSESERPSAEAEVPKALNLDLEFPAKTQEPAEVKETRGVTANCEKADCSGPPLLLNSVTNGTGWPQRGGKIPKNMITCQTNGFLSTGSSASPESDPVAPAKERHSGMGGEHLAAAETHGKAGVSAARRQSDGSWHFVHRDATVTEETLLSLHLKGSCNNTNMPECTLLPIANVNLSSFMPNEEVVPVRVKATLEGSRAVESKEELAEGAAERAEVNVGLDTQFTVPELPVPGEDSEGRKFSNTVLAQNIDSLKQAKMKDQDMERRDQIENNSLDCSDDMKEPAELLASSPLIEQLGNSSFTIIYEGALQTENKSVSTDDTPTASLPSPGSPPGCTGHLPCDTAQGEHEPACRCGQDPQLKEAGDGRGSESFLSVEAKRYRVYPFSLSPIYEDDSSQEDLPSTDMSPESRPGGTSKDSSDHASVLSLLQSVSERLQFTARFSEEEEEEEEGPSYEENTLDVEKEDDCLSCHWRGSLKTALQLNDENRSLLPEQSFLLSREQLDSQEQPEPFPDVASPTQTPGKSVPGRADAALTHPPTSAYYQYLKSASSSSSEKGTRFGSFLQDMLQPKIHWSQDNTVPKLGELSANLIDRTSLKCNPRPGKIIIYDNYGSRSKQEIHSDVLDSSSWTFPTGALLRIIRGCWIFYEKPKFQGRKYVLEEGEAVLDHLWDLPGVKHHRRNLSVGSIRHVTKDCGIPEVEFCPAAGTAEALPICIQGAIPSLEELDVERNPYLRVRSGVWLAYSDFNYKGEVTVLEEGGSPSEIPSADVRSLRPLKMGGLKVQMPMNVKIIIYEKTHFGGQSREFSENVPSVPALFASQEELQGIGSVRVLGGVWVAYDKERYKGHQYLLEEGDYEDRHRWGGTDGVLLSFRFLQADFMESSVALFQSDDEDGKALDITNEEIPDLEKAGFGPETRSILVRSGVWVAYQQKHFCGEQYVLEKGKYKCFFDWGASSKTIMSIRPVKLEPLGTNEPPHLLKAFSSTHFQGACIDFTAEVSDFTSFIPCSFKVLRGCWLLCYEGEITDSHCVLEEGLYVDLGSCGCPTAAIKSLKPIQYVFAEPSISLFTLECCKGRELHFSEPISSVLNEDLHFYTQSVWVRSGLWVAYEGCNFLGRQILLEPGEVSNWNKHSGWKVIGSLRPVKQPAVFLRLRSRAQGRYLTVAGSLADVRATSVCASPCSGRNTQLWHYSRGLLKSRANNACLDVIGGRDVPGAKVALWAEHGKDRQKWRLNEDGTISSYLSEQLVLDIKGGNYYDKNHIIMNQAAEDRLSQKWDIEIL